MNYGEKIRYFLCSILANLSIAEDKEISIDEFEQQIRNLAKCQIVDGNLDSKCPELKIVQETARNSKYIDNKQKAEVIKKLYSAKEPQVRGYAVGRSDLLSTLFGKNEKQLVEIEKLIKDEKEPFVIANALSFVSNELRKSETLANFAIEQSKAQDKNVRKKAVIALSSAWSKGVKGQKEALLAALNDDEADVRNLACAGLGKTEDESVIPEIEKILKDSSKQKMHSSCADGLANMFFNYPFHKNTSEAAYKVWLEYVSQTPRTKELPYWSVIGKMNHRAEKSYGDWETRATYFKKGEVIKLMTEIASDKDSPFLVKTQAIEFIAVWGTVAQLEALTPVLAEIGNSAEQKALADRIEKKKKEGKK